MPESAKMLECGAHGARVATFLCGHLTRGVGLGWITGDDPGNPFPDAWCRDCDRVLAAEGGAWNDRAEAFADLRMVCSGCYEEYRRRNAGPPGPPSNESLKLTSALWWAALARRITRAVAAQLGR